MSSAGAELERRRKCHCGCELDLEPDRGPRALYRHGHRQRAARRRDREARAAFWGRLGEIRRRRPPAR